MDEMGFFPHIVVNSSTGSGKTSVLITLLQLNFKVLYFSPLKAINEEFFKRVDQLGFRGHLNFQDWDFSFENLDFLICTPESFFINNVSLPHKNISSWIFVIDELHLFFSWGKSFRPYLLDALVESFEYKGMVISLSATITKDCLQEYSSELMSLGRRLLYINAGNFKLNCPPSKFMYLPYGKLADFVEISQLYLNSKKGIILFFCQYRVQVELVKNLLENDETKVISARGGELGEFVKKVSHKRIKSQVIVSTSVLSHGVNLRGVSLVVIWGKSFDEETWFQMVGRGGRFGERFDLLANSCPDHYEPLQRSISLFYGLFNSLRAKLYHWIFS